MGRKDNDNLILNKSDKFQRLVYEQYCLHLAAGYPQNAFVLDLPDYPDYSITYKTIESLIKSHPAKFPPHKKAVAYAKGLKGWIDLGKKMMLGEFEKRKVQPALYQLLMRNIYGWDKETPEEQENRITSEAIRLKEVWAAMDETYRKIHAS